MIYIDLEYQMQMRMHVKNISVHFAPWTVFQTTLDGGGSDDMKFQQIPVTLKHLCYNLVYFTASYLSVALKSGTAATMEDFGIGRGSGRGWRFGHIVLFWRRVLW